MKIFKLLNGNRISYKSLEKNIITVGISETKVIEKDNTNELLALNAEYIKIGNKLTLSDGKIIIGKGINYVRISGQVFYSVAKAITRHALRICKNTHSNVVGFNTIMSQIATSNNCCPTITSIIVPVTEGDKILALVSGAVGDAVSGANATTYITVEVVD